MLSRVQKYWAWVIGFFVSAAAILTVIVRTETVWHWIVPRDPHGLEGSIYYDYQDTSFFWPKSFDSHPEHQPFIRNAASFVKINMQNQSSLEVADFRVTLTGDALVEVKSKDDVRTFAPSDTFDLGSVKAGERITVLLWLRRPFSLDERITVTNQFGGFTIIPTMTLGAGEYYFYRNGYYILLVIVVLLAGATLVLAGMLYKIKTMPQNGANVTSVGEPQPDTQSTA